jgi:polysaccharide deacetylase family sporulation protein PdaB
VIIIQRRRAAILAAIAFPLLAVALTRPPSRAAMGQALVAGAGISRRLPVYAVATAEPVVALSFDAAWGAGRTSEILAILADHGVRATFFLVGFWIDRYPEMVEKIAAAGHDLGNHSATHPRLEALGREAIAREIGTVHRQLQRFGSGKPFLFRPPFGAYSDRVIEVAEELGYLTIQWSVDSLDWRPTSPERIVKRVLDQAHPGAIVLFHNDGEHTPAALAPIIQGLRARGYRLAPISELVYREHFRIDHRGFQHRRPNAR